MKPNLSNFMFQLNQSQEQQENQPSSQYFTILGDHDYLDDNKAPRTKTESKKTFAKTENNKFYIKIGAYNRLLNPMGLFSEGTENRFLSRIGRQEWVFKQVKESTFQMYVKFLSTKNIAWLQTAEREMI